MADPQKLVAEGGSLPPQTAALSDSQVIEFLRDLHEIITIFRPDGTINYISHAVGRILGYEPIELVNREVCDYVHPDDLPALLMEFAKVFENKSYHVQLEFRALHKSGGYVYLESIGSNWLDEPHVEGLLVNLRDVTHKKEAEKTLRENEERFRSVVETANDVIITVDRQGIVHYTNSAISAIFGYEPQELIGLNLNLLMPDYLRELHAKGMKRYAETKQKHISWQATELPAVHKNGQQFPIELSLGEFYRNGQIFFTGIIRDITGRKKVEQELQIAKERAEESDRLKSSFLAMMSHEIRTPLNAILGFSNVIYSEIEHLIEPEMRSYFDIIQSSGSRLMRFISNLLDISRLQAGELIVTKSRCNLASIAHDVLASHAEPARAKLVEIVEDFSEQEDYSVDADSERLAQAISHIVENAIKFTSSGVIFVRLRKEEDGELHLSISDTGVGIHPDALQFIFDPFRQVDEGVRRSWEGAGLGLTISQRLVQLMGGQITVISKQGEGSTFNIVLPPYLGELELAA